MATVPAGASVALSADAAGRWAYAPAMVLAAREAAAEAARHIAAASGRVMAEPLAGKTAGFWATETALAQPLGRSSTRALALTAVSMSVQRVSISLFNR